MDEIPLALSLEENKFVCADMVENKNYVQKEYAKAHMRKHWLFHKAGSDFWLFYEWAFWVGDVGDDANRTV